MVMRMSRYFFSFNATENAVIRLHLIDAINTTENTNSIESFGLTFMKRNALRI